MWQRRSNDLKLGFYDVTRSRVRLVNPGLDWMLLSVPFSPPPPQDLSLKDLLMWVFKISRLGAQPHIVCSRRKKSWCWPIYQGTNTGTRLPRGWGERNMFLTILLAFHYRRVAFSTLYVVCVQWLHCIWSAYQFDLDSCRHWSVFHRHLSNQLQSLIVSPSSVFMVELWV